MFVFKRAQRCLFSTARSVSEQAQFGRPSNNLSSGIVGLANVGKSTFFQAITKSRLGNPANYPFATIKPEEARVMVPSETLDHLQRLYGSQDKVPATLKVIDIAGLVRGASNGSGLGNQFLNDIRQVDGIYQVVRAFVDLEITHVEGNVDPVRDMTVVMDELLLKDMEFVENGLLKLQKSFKKNIKSPLMSSIETEIKVLEKCYDWLMEGQRIANKKDWSPVEIEVLNSYNLLTTKPTIYLVNVNEADYHEQKNQFLPEILEWVEQFSPNSQVVLFSASYESDLIDSGDDERSVIPKAIQEMRKALNLISFYTCGEKEARQWTVRAGSSAPQCAGVIHTDLQKTFINANVIKYDDLKEMAPPFDEKLIIKNGKQHRVGKSYVVEDGDIVLFKATGSKSKK